MDTTEPPKNMEEELDSEIATVRAEIRNLQRKRRFLASSLLSSDNFQKYLQKHQSSRPSSSLDAEVSPLVRAAGQHAEVNHHRVAFSATTFPFKDPSPNSENPNLLGVRIDVCTSNGRFTKPYYVLLKRVRGEDKRLRVHRHTIPAFISVDKLERAFLPVPAAREEEAGENLKPWKRSANRQNLSRFVRELRRQLAAWHLRMDAVNFLRGKLGVQRRGVEAYSDDDDGVWVRDILSDNLEEIRLDTNDLGIVSLSPTALDATYVRLEWEDGRVGRFKMSDNGVVERAVVIGDDGRDKLLEAVLTGGNGRVETVLDRLKQHLVSKE
ncbi:Cenp-O kinetochore centromere component-domain-containing protein [Aspergillus pseudonomiae]|uniref:Cenp-O kinetochore centromere component-domain-containing protein n=1 Tax=Aspergillus pseudonomiae TaxID=1506151 RepID=A0A5N6HZU8_9EURO|nr:Cenp-O kinetochore centromere component-domain-containing protein [Aspergillus pseudonomiae]KAB8260002.1 Cenp-O kinetochore centromere component-domain-containing protein [Aspergillus pseudonomiae]KAE8407708.1 Cenp-O kinetochore centromere component-domain-containing protein [Aspergillus pseudonomiae]